MTCFLRNAFLALVAFATLAIIVMMAMTAEAAEAKEAKPAAETAASADTARQIVVEEKAKPSDTVTPAKDEDAASRQRPQRPRPLPTDQPRAPRRPQRHLSPKRLRLPSRRLCCCRSRGPMSPMCTGTRGYGYHGGYDHCD